MRRTELTAIAQRVVFTMGMLALCSHTTIAETGSVTLLDFTKGDKPRDAAESYWLHADGFSGIPNGVEEKGKDANQIYLCSRVAETQGNGILQVGDVLLVTV